MILENSTTPNISGDDVFLVGDQQQISNFIGGQPDDIRYFIFTCSGTKIKSNDNIKLEGQADFSPATGDTLVLLYDGECWFELTRSLNPLYDGIALNDYQMDNAFIERQIELLRRAISSNLDYFIQNINNIQNQIDSTNYGGSVNVLTELTYSIESIDTIQVGINNLGRYLQEDVYIYLTEGVYNVAARMDFDDFYGPGNLWILGPTSQFVYTQTKNTILSSTGIDTPLMSFKNCLCGIRLNGFQINHNNTQTDEYCGGLNFINCQDVEVCNLSINGVDYITNGLHFYKTNATVLNCFFQKGKAAIFANERSRVLVENCDDYSFMPQYGLYASRASMIGIVDNQIPDGSIDDYYQDRGGMVVV